MKLGINSMGSIGRLALRAAMGAVLRPEDDPRAGNRLDVVHVNEIKGGAAATAHLIQFDSVQGRWRSEIAAEANEALLIGGAVLLRAQGRSRDPLGVVMPSGSKLWRRSASDRLRSR